MEDILVNSIYAPEIPSQKEAWQDDAMCTEVSPETFFPSKGKGTADALTICDSCEVIVDCLKYVFKLEGFSPDTRRFGIFAKMTPTQRRNLAISVSKSKSHEILEPVG